VVVFVFLLLVPPLVTVLPGSPGTMRVAGITLLWWYAAVVGPLAAALGVVLARAVR